MSRVEQKAQVPEPPLRSCFPTFTVIGTIGLLLLVGISFLRSEGGKPSAPQPVTVAESEAAETAVAEPAASDSPASSAIPTVPRSRSTSAGRLENPVAAGPASVASQELIDNLTQIRIDGGKLSAVQAQAVRQNLQQLVAQGAPAVPAIAAFLKQNQDLAFGDDASKLAGVPSLRAGLIDALGQIGGPEAIEVSRQILQTSPDPIEISLLARNLEEASPGQYRQDTLEAARQSLAAAATGKLADKDLAPVFQVLQTYGDASVATDLETASTNWNWYAILTLAGLSSGQGVPSLVKLAQASDRAGTGQYKLALQMLAQASAQFPDAASALVDMAQQNRIPDAAWQQVVTGLAGKQYQFTRQSSENNPSSESTLEMGNSAVGGSPQKFYSTTLPFNGTTADASQRLALIDQLLAANPNNPAAQAALQSARARLAGAAGSK